MANYCRSPVAEKILSNTCEDVAVFSSSGIRPYPSASMDKRSYDFLDEINVSEKIHTPRKITQEIVDQADLVIAMDLKILSVLNSKFKKNRDKIRVFSYLSNHIDVTDPFKKDLEGYLVIMQNIKELCDTFKTRLLDYHS